MARKPNFTAAEKKRTKEALLDTLKKIPIIETACQKVGITRMTFYRWIKDDEELKKGAKEALSEGKLLINDLAESKLISAVNSGELRAAQWWLRHHHKDYGQKVQVEGRLEVDSKLTPEEERIIAQAIQRMSPNISSPTKLLPNNPKHAEQ